MVSFEDFFSLCSANILVQYLGVSLSRNWTRLSALSGSEKSGTVLLLREGQVRRLKPVLLATEGTITRFEICSVVATLLEAC
jgi:hypothetical protein